MVGKVEFVSINHFEGSVLILSLISEVSTDYYNFIKVITTQICSHFKIFGRIISKNRQIYLFTGLNK